MEKETIKIRIPRYFSFNYSTIMELFNHKLIMFLCLLIIYPYFIEPAFATNYSINDSENINQSNFLTNITCQANYTFINGTCTNINSLNLTQPNETIVERDPCFNISCQENYQCTNGRCLVNLSNENIDFEVIEEISSNDWVSVVVSLYEGESYSSNEEMMSYFNSTQESVLLDLSDEDFRFVHSSSYVNYFSGYVSITGLEKLANNPLVREVRHTEEITANLIDSTDLINANNVWEFRLNNFNISGLYQTVCVIDTGIDAYHPDLAGKVLAQKCFCHNSTGGCCLNGDSEDDNAFDDNGHGTHVAGIVAANGSIRGVANGTSIVAVKVLDIEGKGALDDVDLAINWCLNLPSSYNLSVITMSLSGGSLFDDYCDNTDPINIAISSAVNNASAQGIFVDASSGNNGNITHMPSPACIYNVTSVGSVYDANVGTRNWCKIWNEEHTQCIEYLCNDTTTSADKLSCFSNRFSQTNLFAPGSIITSTVPNGSCYDCDPSGYNSLSGTSQAAPHVAGVAALMKHANSSLTPADIRSILTRTGKLVYDSGINSTNGGSGLTFPRVDAYRSVMASIHDLVVSDVEVFDKGESYRLYKFNVFNDLNQTVNDVNFGLDLGDGSFVYNDESVSFQGFKDLWVFVEHNYTINGDLVINASSNSTSDVSNSQSIVEDLDNFGVNNLTEMCSDCDNTRIFWFTLDNYYGDRELKWSINYGDGNISEGATENKTVYINNSIFDSTYHDGFNQTGTAPTVEWCDCFRDENKCGSTGICRGYELWNYHDPVSQTNTINQTLENGTEQAGTYYVGYYIDKGGLGTDNMTFGFYYDSNLITSISQFTDGGSGYETDYVLKADVPSEFNTISIQRTLSGNSQFGPIWYTHINLTKLLPDNSIQISDGEKVWMFIEYNYSSTGEYIVNATATSGGETANSTNILVNIT